MLIALGAQLAAAGRPKFSGDLVWSSVARLVGAPLIALALAALFGFSGLERAVGVIQAAMPTAVLASIIAVENDLLPDFVISAVLVSTLLSLLTLTVVLAIV
jgi:predicted permease